MTSLINANSPLTWDATMLGALKVYARNNQALLTTPFILAGAMAPVTIVGACTVTLAEALSGMAFVQLLNPGCPVILGSFASSISMQSGAPTFGTPEPSLVLYTMAALARRVGVPFRSGGALCASKVADAQAAYESANTMNATCLARRQFRAAHGGLARGRALGRLREIRHRCRPGRHDAFLPRRRSIRAITARRWTPSARSGRASTSSAAPIPRRISQTAFYRSPLADNNSAEQWEAEGSLDMAQRANAVWKKMLREYEAPPIDPGVDEALLDFMARKKAEVPDSNV